MKEQKIRIVISFVCPSYTYQMQDLPFKDVGHIYYYHGQLYVFCIGFTFIAV